MRCSFAPARGLGALVDLPRRHEHRLGPSTLFLSGRGGGGISVSRSGMGRVGVWADVEGWAEERIGGGRGGYGTAKQHLGLKETYSDHYRSFSLQL